MLIYLPLNEYSLSGSGGGGLTAISSYNNNKNIKVLRMRQKP